jgi:hypothetical protein
MKYPPRRKGRGLKPYTDKKGQRASMRIAENGLEWRVENTESEY